MNFDDLSEENRNRIVADGMCLMRTITEICGPDEGIALWDRMADAVSPDFKHRVFLCMMNTPKGVILIHGDTSYRTGPHHMLCVPLIKKIRQITGYGLKEAKDVFDNVAKGVSVSIPLDKDMQRHVAVEDLKQLGVKVT